MNNKESHLHQLNDGFTLSEAVEKHGNMAWVSHPTAILVIHGMGSQKPMETLEQFGKTLIQTYEASFPDKKFIVEHLLEKKRAKRGNYDWYDDKLRIRMVAETGAIDENFIDLYEYYWANKTEGKADWNDINDWIQGIAGGARKYYSRNLELAEQYVAKDIAEIKEQKEIIKKHRKDKWDIGYYFFLVIIGHLVLLIRLLGRLLKSLINYIPFIGTALTGLFESFVGNTAKTVGNIMSDLVAYSVTDAKSKYYPVRRAILDGAVKALQFLIEHGVEIDKKGNLVENEHKKNARTYKRILVAGHSLGSQVGYDAINRINLMVNHCKIAGYNEKGDCSVVTGNNIRQQLSGFITFGSPLDKSAFFLRENIPAEEFVRQQMLNNFLDFKQRDWTDYVSAQNGYFPIVNKATPERLFEEMPWRNYHDKHDYVSGSLDYYHNLENIDCTFPGNIFSFTHSNYWNCPDFYKDIIFNFLK